MFNKALLYTPNTNKSPINYFEFTAAKDGSNVDLFYDPAPSSWKVVINGSTTNQSADSLTFAKGDTVRINYDSTPCGFYAAFKDYFVAIKGALPATNHDFSSCFDECVSLTTIPDGLFVNNPHVTDFTRCFSNCTSLISIPAGLFDNNTKITSFRNCFYNCSSLTSIPEGLFDNNTQVTDFNQCFSSCTFLASIPAGLFDNNLEVDDFSNCFSGIRALESIPAGLFNNNLKVTSFSSCFALCSILTSVPTNIFANNLKVTNFYSCFYKDAHAVINVHIGSDSVTMCNNFASGTKSKGTVYVPQGSTTATTFKQSTSANVNVIEE